MTVPFTLGGTAVAGTDYSGVTASPLIIPAGQTTPTITGTLLADPGPSQTLTFTLGTPTGASLGSPAANTLTITEPAMVQFSTGSETVSRHRHLQHPGQRAPPRRPSAPSPPGSPLPKAWPSTPPATSTSPTTRRATQ